MDENLLKEFAKKDGAAADVIANGGEGFIGENHLILWAAEELAQFNNEYEAQDYAPGLVLFGSDGGGEGYAFDARTIPAPIVQVPFIGMDLMYARQMAGSFSEFVRKLAEKS